MKDNALGLKKKPLTFLVDDMTTISEERTDREMREIIVDRVRMANDDQILSYVEKSVRRIRNLRLGDIRGNVLGRFSDEVLNAFDSMIGEKSEAAIRYNNIVQNRDASAHGMSVNITFPELKGSYREAGKVITAISEVLLE